MKLLGLFLVIACLAIAALVSADEKKADAPACPVPVSPEQSVVVAKANAEYKVDCPRLVKGAFDAFLVEQQKRQTEIERIFRAHESAAKKPPAEPSTP